MSTSSVDLAAGVISVVTGSGEGARHGVTVQLSPEFLSRYRLVRQLGSGATGCVYLARQVATGRDVAIKFLKQLESAELLSRFLQEGQLLADLRHPNLVAVEEVAQDAAHPYMVVEYVPGGSLREHLARAGRLPVDAAIPLALDILAGLQACHARAIVHRDIKPDNVLLDGAGRAKVADLGLAKCLAAGEALTRTGAVMGTPLYMAPEQLRGDEATARTDLYACGAVLYEMLAGRPPFVGRTFPELFTAITTADPKPLALPGPLPALVQRMLAKDPYQRPQSASEIARELTDLRGAARTVPILPDRRPFLVLAAATALGLGIVTGGLRQPRPEPGSTGLPPVTTPAPLATELKEAAELLRDVEDRAYPLRAWHAAGKSPVPCPFVLVCPAHVTAVSIDVPAGVVVTCPGGLSIDRPARLSLSEAGLVEGLNWFEAAPGARAADVTVRIERGPCPVQLRDVPVPGDGILYDRVMISMRADPAFIDSESGQRVIADALPDPRDPFRVEALRRLELMNEDFMSKFIEARKDHDDDPVWSDPAKLATVRSGFADIQRALQLSPRRWDVWHDTGMFLRLSDQSEVARAALARAIVAWPGSYLSWRELARLERHRWSVARRRPAETPRARRLRFHRDAGNYYRLTTMLLRRAPRPIPWITAECESEHRQMEVADE